MPLSSLITSTDFFLAGFGDLGDADSGVVSLNSLCDAAGFDAAGALGAEAGADPDCSGLPTGFRSAWGLSGLPPVSGLALLEPDSGLPDLGFCPSAAWSVLALGFDSCRGLGSALFLAAGCFFGLSGFASAFAGAGACASAVARVSFAGCCFGGCWPGLSFESAFGLA